MEINPKILKFAENLNIPIKQVLFQSTAVDVLSDGKMRIEINFDEETGRFGSVGPDISALHELGHCMDILSGQVDLDELFDEYGVCKKFTIMNEINAWKHARKIAKDLGIHIENWRYIEYDSLKTYGEGEIFTKNLGVSFLDCYQKLLG